MGGMNGLEVQEALIKRANPMPIIFLTAYSDVPHIVRAVKDGAKDFFIKPVEGGVLVDRVQQVIERYLIKLDGANERRELDARLVELTDREREVLELSIEGLSCKGIGVKLGLSYRTVELHRSHICTKTGTENLSALLHQLARVGVFPP